MKKIIAATGVSLALVLGATGCGGGHSHHHSTVVPGPTVVHNHVPPTIVHNHYHAPAPTTRKTTTKITTRRH